MGPHGLKAEVCGVAGAALQASAHAFWQTEWVADSSAVVSSGHGALNSDASEVFATADTLGPNSACDVRLRSYSGRGSTGPETGVRQRHNSYLGG